MKHEKYICPVIFDPNDIWSHQMHGRLRSVQVRGSKNPGQMYNSLSEDGKSYHIMCGKITPFGDYGSLLTMEI